MSGLDSLEGHGPVLAVIDGRFLPVHEWKLHLNQDTEQIQTISGHNTRVKSKQSTVDVGIRTRRRPDVRDSAEWLRMYNRECEMRVEDIQVTNKEVVGAWDNLYSVEVTGLSFEIMARRP